MRTSNPYRLGIVLRKPRRIRRHVVKGRLKAIKQLGIDRRRNALAIKEQVVPNNNDLAIEQFLNRPAQLKKLLKQHQDWAICRKDLSNGHPLLTSKVRRRKERGDIAGYNPGDRVLITRDEFCETGRQAAESKYCRLRTIPQEYVDFTIERQAIAIAVLGHFLLLQPNTAKKLAHQPLHLLSNKGER